MTKDKGKMAIICMSLLVIIFFIKIVSSVCFNTTIKIIISVTFGVTQDLFFLICKTGVLQ